MDVTQLMDLAQSVYHLNADLADGLQGEGLLTLEEVVVQGLAQLFDHDEGQLSVLLCVKLSTTVNNRKIPVIAGKLF